MNGCGQEEKNKEERWSFTERQALSLFNSEDEKEDWRPTEEESLIENEAILIEVGGVFGVDKKSMVIVAEIKDWL